MAAVTLVVSFRHEHGLAVLALPFLLLSAAVVARLGASDLFSVRIGGEVLAALWTLLGHDTHRFFHDSLESSSSVFRSWLSSARMWLQAT